MIRSMCPHLLLDIGDDGGAVGGQADQLPALLTLFVWVVKVEWVVFRQSLSE